MFLCSSPFESVLWICAVERMASYLMKINVLTTSVYNIPMRSGDRLILTQINHMLAFDLNKK